MSNIYISEPPTHGKVVLKTSVGDIDIELWSREAPKACRNFVQLCLENYYDNTIFHTVIRGFIVQGGDPTGTGHGGESIYGEPFKDEFHSRLRFIRRGLVATASPDKDGNGSQFVFTFAACPELQNKHTIFGKITGDSLFNMLKLEESETDRNDRPLYPHKILSTQIISNPFTDIIPREIKVKEEKIEKKKEKTKGVKDFKLLSFGDEAEEEEEEVVKLNRDDKNRIKSSHDVLKNDPKLSSKAAIDPKELSSSLKSRDSKSKSHNDSGSEDEKRKKKLRSHFSPPKESLKDIIHPSTSKKDFEHIEPKLSKKEVESNKLCKLRDEFKSLTKEVKHMKKPKKEVNKIVNPVLEEHYEGLTQFKLTEKFDSKEKRAESTLALLEKFRSKLAQKPVEEKKSDEKEAKEDDGWMHHQFVCEDEKNRLAKDANLKNEEDWYDIYDPRNPLNKRRREKDHHSKSSSSSKRSHSDDWRKSSDSKKDRR